MKSAGMSLSCLPVSLYGEFGAGTLSLVDWFDLARDAGYDGADISVAHLDSLEEGYLHGLRDQAAARAIQVPMLVTYSTSPTRRRPSGMRTGGGCNGRSMRRPVWEPNTCV